MSNFSPDELPLGWLHPGETELLTELARDRVVLELGAWKGRSTCAMARTAKLVVSVDWHRGDWATAGPHPDEDTLTPYLLNVREHPNIVPIIGRFEDVLPLLSAQFGLAFIDGAHDYASVERDARMVKDLYVPVIAAHDWNCAPLECMEALRDVLGEPSRVVDYTAVWE